MIVQKGGDWIDRTNLGSVIRVDDIVTKDEAAVRLGVGRSTLYSLAKRRAVTGFPLPLHGDDGPGRGTPVYHYPTIKDFYDRYLIIKTTPI